MMNSAAALLAVASSASVEMSAEPDGEDRWLGFAVSNLGLRVMELVSRGTYLLTSSWQL